MKKIWVWLLVGLSIFGVSKIKVEASTLRLEIYAPYGLSADVNYKWTIKNSNVAGNSDTTAYAQLKINGVNHYCLRADIYTVEGATYNVDQFDSLELPAYMVEQLGIISSLGYGFENDYSHEMDFATQIRIWQALHEYNPNKHSEISHIDPEIQISINKINQRLAVYNANLNINNKHIVFQGYGKQHAVVVKEVPSVLAAYSLPTSSNLKIEKANDSLTLWIENRDIKKGNIEMKVYPSMKTGTSIAYSSPDRYQDLGFLQASIHKKAEFTYEVKTGTVEVSKQGEVVSKWDDKTKDFIYEEQLLDGVTLQLLALEDIVNPSTKEVLYAKNSVVASATTIKDEILKFEDLPFGRYGVQEIEAADGYELNNEIQEVIFDEKGMMTQSVAIFNKRKQIDIQVIKKDHKSKEPLQGATFALVLNKDLLDLNGNLLVKKDSTLQVKTSDIEGRVTFDLDLPYDNDTSEEAMYRIEERLAPNGYHLNKQVLDVDVRKGKYFVYDVYNDEIMTHIVFQKVDAKTKEPIKTEMFKMGLYQDEAATKLIKEVTIDKRSGLLTFENLAYGTYYFKELKAPNGYQLSNQVMKIVIDENLKKDKFGIHFICFENEKIKEVKTSDHTILEGYIGICVISIVSVVALYKRMKKKKQDNL